MFDRRLPWLLLLGALAACGGSNGSGSAASTADSVTKAAYNNDVDGVTSSFDDHLKTQVSRAEVGVISDRMHSLGTYKGLTLLASDASKNEFTYRAAFDKGTMNVVVRLDPDGKLSAYRIFVPPGS